MKQLNEYIETIIKETLSQSSHAEFFRAPILGVSSATNPKYNDLKHIIGEWHKLPVELLPEASCVISYFVPFTKAVIQAPKEVDEGIPVWDEAYNFLNDQFLIINNKIVDYLASQNYSSVGIAPTGTYDPSDLKSFWSHRSAAAIAGLGSFGIHNLLITDKGCGGRMCTVISSAPLEISEKEIEEKCLYKKDRSCGICIDVCPVGALHEDFTDKFACQDELGHTDTCGKCNSICPLSYIE